MGAWFGTDGVRGVAGSELTPELAFQLGLAGAATLAARSADKPSVLVGTDTRISKDMLLSALVAGILAAGADAHTVGIVPTPCVAYLTRAYRMSAGVVISASHNTYEYNGIKFFSSDGFKLPDALEDEIEATINSGLGPRLRATSLDLGVRFDRDNAAHEYIEHVKRRLSVNLSGWRMVVDCANGASYALAPALFRDLGADVHAIGVEPDGFNINEGCGSTHMKLLQQTVIDGGYDIGLAFDGDADRLLVVSSAGEIVDGDAIMAIIAKDMKAQGELTNNTLVTTAMSNLGLDRWAESEGITLVKTKVGDRYVLEAMRAGGHAFGGEQSGHFIVLEHTTTGDGLLSALRLLNALVRNNWTIDDVAQMVRIVPQVLKNARIRSGTAGVAMSDEILVRAIDDVTERLAGRGRVLVRASGTEPLIRVMIEGDDREEIHRLADDLVGRILSRYGA